MSENQKNETPTYGGYDAIAAEFGIKKNTLYSLVSQGSIPHKRIGRRHVLFSFAEIRHWIESGGALKKQKAV